MIAAAFWAGYLAAHPAWPLIFAACCAAAAVYVWCMRAEDKRDDRAAGLSQAPRRGTRFSAGARAALARGTSWARRAIALRIRGITIDVTNIPGRDGARGPVASQQGIAVDPAPETGTAQGQPEMTPVAASPAGDLTRLATGAERAAAAPRYAPELAPPAALSPWEHQTMWFTLDAIDADIKARAAADGDA